MIAEIRTLRFSIITVTFNSAATVEDTIMSIDGQDYPDVEHIVIDGASTDGTQDILFKHQRKITRWISEPDLGMYDAMNKGIAMASGDVIGILNSDDVYAHKRVLEGVARTFKKTTIDACYSDLVYVATKDLSKIVRYIKSCDYRDGLFAKGWCPPHPTFFVKRNVYRRLGSFDLSYTIGNDVELMMRFLSRYRIQSKYIPEVMVRMRVGGVSNRNIENIIRQNIEIIKAARNNQIIIAPIPFIFFKIISRCRQYLSRMKAF